MATTTDDEWKEISISDNEVWDRQGTLEGTFMSRKANVGPNESMLYTVETKDGLVSVWGSTVLDAKFLELEVGMQVQVTPLGKVRSDKTGREYMDFRVLYKDAPFKEATVPKENLPVGF